MLSRQTNQTFGIGLHELSVRTGVRYVITNFSCFHMFPIYFSNGALPVRKLRYKEVYRKNHPDATRPVHLR